MNDRVHEASGPAAGALVFIFFALFGAAVHEPIALAPLAVASLAIALAVPTLLRTMPPAQATVAMAALLTVAAAVVLTPSVAPHDRVWALVASPVVGAVYGLPLLAIFNAIAHGRRGGSPSALPQ